MAQRILYVEGCRDGTVGGSHVSLHSMVANLDRTRFVPVIVFYDDHAIAAKLRSLGAEVHVLRDPGSLDLRRRLAARSPLLGHGAALIQPLQKAANFVRTFLWPGVSAAVFLRRHAIDLVHLNNSINGNHEWMLASLLARVPYVSHERGVSESLSRTARFFAHRASTVVCISHAIRDMLVGQGLAADRTLVVYNGIDPASLRPGRDAASIRTALGIGPADAVIGVVGNLKQWKGQDVVVRATAELAKRWPTIRCVLVGATGVDPAFDARLRALVDDLGLRDQVMLTGFQDNPSDYVGAMDVVVHASTEPEPFGRVNIEAMFLGKPVVSTNIGGPTEIFVDGHDGMLIAPGDADLLARTIATLLESEALRRRLGGNARSTVVARFTIAQTMRSIEAIYAGVLGTSSVAALGTPGGG